MTTNLPIRHLAATELDLVCGGTLGRMTVAVVGPAAPQAVQRKAGEGQKDFLVIKLKEA